MFQVGLPCYLGLNSDRSASINVNKTRKPFPELTIHGARMFPQFFPTYLCWKHCFQCRFLFPRCKLCLRYTAGNFNENPSMRADAKILRARASEHSSIFASNSSKGQILRAPLNWMGPFDTPKIARRKRFLNFVFVFVYSVIIQTEL